MSSPTGGIPAREPRQRHGALPGVPSVPGLEWFLRRVAGAEPGREARELAEAEHAARSAGCTVRWDPTWTCELLPAHDPEGRIDARESVDLDAHPAVDPRARDIERVLLATASPDSPEMADGFYIQWRREPTCRVRGPDGRLLAETNEPAPRDRDGERYEAALIIREALDAGTLTLPGHKDARGAAPSVG